MGLVVLACNNSCFTEGRRTMDVILAWLQGKLKASLSNLVKSCIKIKHF